MQLLECFSYGLDEAFRTLQHTPQQQQYIPAVLHATRCSSANSTAAVGRAQQPVQGWGMFELQRRCCAVYADLLHSQQQQQLLYYSMDAQATAGRCGPAAGRGWGAAGTQGTQACVLPSGLRCVAASNKP